MANNDFFTELREAEEAPHIKYDQKEIKPDVIEQKKWDFIYKAVWFVLLICIYLASFFINSIQSINQEIAEEQVRIEDLEPIVDKMWKLKQDLNYEKMVINQFLMESLFFVSEEKYEMIHKLKLFFEDPKVMANLWDFKVRDVAISWWEVKENNWVWKMSLKITGTYTTYKDLTTMIDFLNNMKPVVVTEAITLNQWNSVQFNWYIYILNKDLITYDYGGNYKKINSILRMKEEFEKNNLLLEKVLEDKDLWLDKLWIEKIYSCQQYEELLKKKDLVKEENLKTCKQLENLVVWLKSKLNSEFNTLLR